MVSPAIVKAVTPLNTIISRAPHRDISHLPFPILLKAYATSMSQCKKYQSLDIFGTDGTSTSSSQAAEQELVEVRAEVDQVMIGSLLHRRVGQVRSLFGEQQQTLSYTALPILHVPGYNDNNIAPLRPSSSSTNKGLFDDDDDGASGSSSNSKAPSTSPSFSHRLCVPENVIVNTMAKGSNSSSKRNKHAVYVMAPDALIDPAFVRFIRGEHGIFRSGGGGVDGALPNPTFAIPFSSLHTALSPSSADVHTARTAVDFLTRAMTGPLHRQFVVIPPSVEMGWVVSLLTSWVPPHTLSDAARSSPQVKKAVLQAVMTDPLARAGYVSYMANRRWATGSGGETGIRDVSTGGATPVKLCTSERGSRYQTLVADPFAITSTSPNSLDVLQLATMSAAHGAAINGCASAAESLRRRIKG